MTIQHLELKNFRCYQDFSIDLHERFTLLVGNNGTGKTTILDGLAIGLACYFLGMEGYKSIGIQQSDVRIQTFELGSRLERQAQYPASVLCIGTLAGESATWSRSLNTSKSNSTFGDAKALSNLAKNLAESVVRGDKSILLPVLSYYGTGRLWAHKKEKRENAKVNLLNRFSGYADCLDTISNQKLMYKWFEQMTYQELQEGKTIPELRAVQKAILHCFNSDEETSDLGKASTCMYNVKTGEIEIIYTNHMGQKEVHPLSEMSDGYRNMLSMVADIAYRMAVLNPQLLDYVTEETSGVVLIDEIDLHLHPAWQRRVVKDLQRIFPKVQFIATTHAPSVISSMEDGDVILLEDHKKISVLSSTYGKDVNSVMCTIMGVPERPDDVKKKLETIYENIEKQNFENATLLLEELTTLLGENDPDIVGARTALELESME